jgi:uncharacterized iron-regulated membrane protein
LTERPRPRHPANSRIWNRRLHRWVAVAVALPFLIVAATGVLLQLKKQVAWVQPPEQQGSDPGSGVTIGFEHILAAARSAPAAGITSWADVDRLDVRPGKGLIKVQGTSRWEVQVDAATGDVLQVAYRRSDLLESIHDGSFFHPLAKLGVFLPAGMLVLTLWVTGIYLFLLPHRVRRARARAHRLPPGPKRITQPGAPR